MEALDRVDKFRYSNGDLSTASIRRNMQRNMQRNAAVFRIDKTLKEGIPFIES